MKNSVQLSNYLSRVCFGLIFLIFFGFSSVQLKAQQNPYPFNIDLSFGGGLIGNPDANTTFQPELGFSYMPGKFGVGLNAGLLSYDPSFDAQQYAAGFEEYTSVSGSGEKWSSFFFGIGPRFEFGSQLPVTFRSSLDLSLSYNSPPSVSVDFNDPDGSAAGVDLQLSGYQAGEDYSKWSAAIRPEFQMQFSPGGSDRFAIQVTTGIQHRLSKNEFIYSQRDLSEVQVVRSSQEMFMQFEMAPEVQQTAQPPQTNFFTTVGLKIKFGGSRAPAAPGQDYNSSRSNKPTSRAEDIGDHDEDSDDDGVPDAVETAQDYNSSRSNKPRTEDGRGGNDDIVREANRMARLVNPTGIIVKAGGASLTAKGKKPLGLSTANGENPLYEGSSKEGENPLYKGEANDGDSDDNDEIQDPSAVQQYNLQPSSYCMEVGSPDAQQGMRSDAQNHNSSRSNRTSGVANPDLDGDGFPDMMKSASFSISKRSARTGRNPSGDEDMDSDGDGIHFDMEIDPIDPDDDGDGISDAIESATYSISKRSARTGRSASTDNNESESMEWDGNAEKQMASDDDPCGPGVWARTTGGNANCTPENSDQENPVSEAKPPNNVHQWTYNLNSLANGQDMPGGTLTVLFTGGEWHFDVQVDHVDPDDDGDGFGDLLQNSSFSISKRSARTGRNPQTDKEIRTATKQVDKATPALAQANSHLRSGDTVESIGLSAETHSISLFDNDEVVCGELTDGTPACEVSSDQDSELWCWGKNERSLKIESCPAPSQQGDDEDLGFEKIVPTNSQANTSPFKVVEAVPVDNSSVLLVIQTGMVPDDAEIASKKYQLIEAMAKNDPSQSSVDMFQKIEVIDEESGSSDKDSCLRASKVDGPSSMLEDGLYFNLGDLNLESNSLVFVTLSSETSTLGIEKCVMAVENMYQE